MHQAVLPNQQQYEALNNVADFGHLTPKGNASSSLPNQHDSTRH